jgi:ATP-dependent RNA helicase HrpB
MKKIYENSDLPIAEKLDELKTSFAEHNTVILQADPGAGKTTLVPLYLLDQIIDKKKKIIMLEPRRLAARMAARRMADMIGEAVGETIGYRIRLENKVSRGTRIEIVTEGILTRRIQEDPELTDVGLLIFDEYHERSLQADLGLALSRQIQEVFRDDLKLLIMSATLEVGKLSKILNGAPVVSSAGRQFPVDTRFLEKSTQERLEIKVAKAIKKALNEETGDILAFLPGAGEISRIQSSLLSSKKNTDISIVPLYGNLNQKEQDIALHPNADGKRKVVLATDIAETSLTINGVRIVIDSGLARSPRFDPNSGMNRLETHRISRASADQRRGRAGRQASGICYRLWTTSEDRNLIEHSPPEIADADLSSLVLELANWGVQDIGEIPWMTVPPSGPQAQAKELLIRLGALDSSAMITEFGRKLVRLPLHPRLAAMVIKSSVYASTKLACDMAAILSERDFLHRNQDAPTSDISDRLNVLNHHRQKGERKLEGINEGALRQVIRSSEDLTRRMKLNQTSNNQDIIGVLLGFAYPDRVGELRDGSRSSYRLSGGKGARLDDGDKLIGEPYIVAAELDGKGREARIFLAASISAIDIEKAFSSDLITRRRVFWDEQKKRVNAVSERCFGALVLDSTRLTDVSPDEISLALMSVVKNKDLKILRWTEEVEAFVNRVAFAKLHEPDELWPDFSRNALKKRIEQWLLPYLSGINNFSGIQALDLLSILKNELGYTLANNLECFAPATLRVPSGSNIRLDYTDPQKPILSVRLQEVFGMKEVPKIANGKVSVTIHLLSPARRPVQVTSDLESFWRTTYNDVKKDLKGRYPKHYWPDDPTRAEATSKVNSRQKK